MIVFVLHKDTNRKCAFSLKGLQHVHELKSLAEVEFRADALVAASDKRHSVLQFAGSDLHDDWLLSYLNLPYGSQLKLITRERNPPDLYVYVKYRRERIELVNTGLPAFNKCLVIDVRILLSRRLGLPLNIFRLKTLGSDNALVLYDYHTLDKYGVKWQDDLVLETWRNWQVDRFAHDFTPRMTDLF